jgi:hypothetical protein
VCLCVSRVCERVSVCVCVCDDCLPIYPFLAFPFRIWFFLLFFSTFLLLIIFSRTYPLRQQSPVPPSPSVIIFSLSLSLAAPGPIIALSQKKQISSENVGYPGGRTRTLTQSLCSREPDWGQFFVFHQSDKGPAQ